MINLLIATISAVMTLNSAELEFKIDREIDIPKAQYDISKTVLLSNICLFSNESDIASELIKQINYAKKTLDIAIYSLTNQDISDAIIKAYNRGVKVRMIIETTKVQTSKIDPAITKLINANVPIRILKGGGLYGIMHNKITLIDSSLLITGSYNFTSNANINNYENVVFVDNQTDINSYKNYFETMWSRAADISYPSKSLSIPSDVPTALLTMINSIRTNIIKMINYSQKTIDIAVYSISDDDIFNTLLNAKNRGVKIRIVTDRLQSTQSATVKKLYDAGFDIKISDGFNKGMMHNKYAVFDNSVVITGSFNWSNNAETYNWENAVLLPSTYAAYFSRNFATIYNQAKPYDGKTSNAGETPVSR